MDDNYESEIRDMISEIIEISAEELTPDADFFNELNVDSLKAIEIVAAFEKRYRKIIPEQDIPNIRTLKHIIEYTKNSE